MYQNIDDLSGKTYIITGANSGLGFALASLLLSKNASIIMLNRSKTRTESAINTLKAKFPYAQIMAYFFDQSEKDSIVNVVENLKTDNVNFAGIVLNAGIYMPEKHATNKNGVPLTFAVNFLGNYFLVEALAKAGLLTSAHRLIFTTSLAANNKLKEEQLVRLTTDLSYNRYKQYKGTKTAINILVEGLMNKRDEIPFVVNAKTYLYHPGIAQSNIAATRFKSINAIVQLAMKLLFHRTEKGAIGALVALTHSDDLTNKVVVPSWPKEWRGLPKVKKIDNNLSRYLPLLIKYTTNL